MNVAPITHPFPGEHLNGVAPVMRPETDASWRRHLNFWTGRALTADALEIEQEHRAAHLAWRGRLVTPGIVNGLEIAVESAAAGKQAAKTFARHFLHVFPGHGIAVTGEDVVVPRPMRVPLDDIPVSYVRFGEGPALPAPGNNAGKRQPWFASFKLGGLSFRLHRFDKDYVPWAAVLVLRPVELDVIAGVNPLDPCEYDPSREAFSDRRRVDAAQLLLCALPPRWRRHELLRGLEADPKWRNRLAHILFEEEANQSPRQHLRFLAAQPANDRWDTTPAPVELSPWELLGVPLGLVGFEQINPGGAAAFEIFLDRAAVVRPGGRARTRARPTIRLATGDAAETLQPPGAGTPFLWRARVDQLAEQLRGLEQLNGPDLAAHFHFLPPAGLLPRATLDFLTTEEANRLLQNDRAAISHFFPAHFGVEAVPIPIEQLDAAFAASAALQRFDLLEAQVPDLVRVLVPLPQRVFDPKLLVIEKEDPFFATEVNRLATIRQGWRQRRDFVRTRRDALRKFILGPAAPTTNPAALEPGQLEPEPGETPALTRVEHALVPPPATVGPWEIRVDFKQAHAALAETKLIVPLRLDEETPPGRIQIRWHRGNAAFTASWSEMPKLATALDGPETKASAVSLWRRFETEPSAIGLEPGDITAVTVILEGGRAALGPVIAIRDQAETVLWEPGGEGDVASPQGAWIPVDQEQLTAPFEDGFTPMLTGDLRFDVQARQLEERLGNDVQIAKEGLQPLVARVEHELNQADDLVDLAFLKAQTATHRIRRVLLGEDAADELLTSPALGSILKEKSALAAQERVAELFAYRKVPAARQDNAAPIAGAGELFAAAPGGPIFAAPTGIPLSSFKFSAGAGPSTTVPDKDDVIHAEPAVGKEFDLRTISIARRFDSGATKTAFDHAEAGLQELLERLATLGIVLGQEENPEPLPDLRLRQDGGDFAEFTLTDLFKGGRAVLNKVVFPEKPGQKETPSLALARGVRRADLTILILRRLERLIARRRELLNLAKTLLAAARVALTSAENRLLVLETKLAEARHDVSVARALWQEERSRVDAINQRRDQLLADEVTFLAFVRPREIDLALRITPGLELDLAGMPAPVPACLQRHDAPPDALRAYIQLFRHAPVRWFPEVLRRLRELDTPQKLAALLESAKEAASRFVNAPAGPLFAAGFAPAVVATYQASFSVVESQRRFAAGLNLVRSDLLSWIDHKQQAEKYASLGDVIEARHGEARLARDTATMLEQIEQVAACLHAEFAAVPPATRLLWVERYSQFDKPAPLRDLTILPGYIALTRDQRRHFQDFVEWFFSKIDSSDAGAFGLMNDLVRLCLLLASHAPVNQIITGHLPRPTPVRPGILIPIKPFHPALVRVGMEFHVWRGTSIVARGSVEDLRDGEVSARVEEAQTATLDETVRVQFMAARGLPFG